MKPKSFVVEKIFVMGEAKRRKEKDPDYGKPKYHENDFGGISEHSLRYVNQEKAEVEDVAFLELCNDVIALLEYADGKEKAIALAIIRKYSQNRVQGQGMSHYEYVDLAIKAKREGDFSSSIDYYNKFFKDSSVGKAWFMTYYGLAKTLAVAGEYAFALVAIKICIELSLLTGCADTDYIYNHHYKNISGLSNGMPNEQYLMEISGYYE